MKKILNKIKNYSKLLMIIVFTITMLNLNTSSILAADHNVDSEYLPNWTWVDTTGHGLYGNVPIITTDGFPSFCVQAQEILQTGVNSDITWTDIGITVEQQSVLSLIANFGYVIQPTTDNYVLTQNLIYRYLGDGGIYGVSSKYPTIESQESWFNDVMSKVNNYGTGVSFDNQEVIVNVGQTITLTDTNNVLSSLQIVSTDGLNVKIEGNKLLVTGTVSAKDNAIIGLKKPIVNEGTNFVVRSGNSQAVSNLKTRDPYIGIVRVKVNKYIDVNLSKVDSDNETFTPQADASLLNTTFGLYNATNGNTLVESKKVDQNGKLKFEKLSTEFKYFIQEISTGEGYVLNDQKFQIDPATLLGSGTVGADLQYAMTVENHVMKQAVDILKISTDGTSGEVQKVPESEWTIKLANDVALNGWDNAKTWDVLTTDEEGFARSIELPYGTYIARETKTPVDMVTARDFTIIIDKDSRTPQPYRILNDAPFKAYLKFIKLDADTGNIITFSNASFQLFDDEGNLVKQKVGDKYIDTYTTDETGTVTTPLMVTAGTYTIKEVKTPNGYLTLDEPLEIVITNQGAVQLDQDGDPILEVKIENDKPTVTVGVTKTFEEFDTDQEKVAKFELSYNSDVVNPATGEIVNKAGEVIPNPDSEDGLYTVADGDTLMVDNLPMSDGKVSYKLTEVSTVDGYVLAEPIIFDFEQNDTTTKVYESKEDVKNILTTVALSKQDLTTKKELPGAHLKLEDVTTGEAVFIEEWISKDVQHIMKGLIVGHTYRLIETIAPEGYKLASAIEFTVENTGEVQTQIMYDELLGGGSSIRTGDTTNTTVFMVMSIISILGGTMIIVSMRKRKLEEEK